MHRQQNIKITLRVLLRPTATFPPMYHKVLNSFRHQNSKARGPRPLWNTNPAQLRSQHHNFTTEPNIMTMWKEKNKITIQKTK